MSLVLSIENWEINISIVYTHILLPFYMAFEKYAEVFICIVENCVENA